MVGLRIDAMSTRVRLFSIPVRFLRRSRSCNRLHRRDFRDSTTTAQLLAMVGWLRLWRVQRAVMESAKQDGIPDTKSAVTPDLLEDA